MTAGAASTVRPMRWPDLAQVTALEARLFPEDPWSDASWWAELAARPRRDYVVLLDEDGVIVGYGGTDRGGDTVDVMTVAVDPSRQGSGHGRTLLTALLERAVDAGVGAALLEVRADNAAAIRLYERHGFTLLRTRPRYYPGGVDALVMRADLTREVATRG